MVPSQETRSDSFQPNLLVVDDDETNRKILSGRLEAEGHKVFVAENGRRALEVIEAQPFDLVLLDILMPEMDGYQVLQYLKSHQTLREIPVIVLSALTRSRAPLGASKWRRRLSDQAV